MTNEIKEQLVEKTMKDMLETLSGVEKYILFKRIVDLQQRIDKAIEYIEDLKQLKEVDYLKSVEMKYIDKLLDILRGD